MNKNNVIRVVKYKKDDLGEPSYADGDIFFEDNMIIWRVRKT